MSKSLTDNTTAKTTYKTQGVFIDECKILAVEDLSNYPLKKSAEIKTIGVKNFAPDLLLKLKVDKGIEMDMYLFGKFNYKTDPISGKKEKYLGWKASGNAVQNLLFKLFGTQPVLNDDDSIMPHILNQMVGQKFYSVRYCQTKEKMYEGKPSFQTWTIFAPFIEGQEEILYKEWLKAAPHIKGYDPFLYDDYMAELRSKEEQFDPNSYNDNKDSVADDDSLPF